MTSADYILEQKIKDWMNNINTTFKKKGNKTYKDL